MKNDKLAELTALANAVVQAHDRNEWDERTIETDLGEAVDELREFLGIEPPDRG